MQEYDVFNGDADGICALLQYRLVNPCESTLITGVKRDIQLLKQVQATDVQVNVFDISFQKNANDVERLLEAGASVFYVDHHQAGELPEYSTLTTLINTSPETCTSLLMNQHLDNAYPDWAVVAAFGDNITQTALALAKKTGLTAEQIKQYKRLGKLINYNAYGDSLSDLHIEPEVLYRELFALKTPENYLNDMNSSYAMLSAGYDDDLEKATQTCPHISNDSFAAYILPDEKWARRISGSLGNNLANQHPDKAHAILTTNAKSGGFKVSVRAPINNPANADVLCSQFPTGGGRQKAAGINHLAKQDLDKFMQAMERVYQLNCS